MALDGRDYDGIQRSEYCMLTGWIVENGDYEMHLYNLGTDLIYNLTGISIFNVGYATAPIE